MLGVPLMREGEPIGAFALARSAPLPSRNAKSSSSQTFADQAVIAIENVRLFNEVQARTRDLTEALQQQTATADVLKVISRSAFDLKTGVEPGRIRASTLRERHGGNFLATATLSLAATSTIYRAWTIRSATSATTGRRRSMGASLEGRVVQSRCLGGHRLADVEATTKDRRTARSVGVPLLREGEVDRRIFGARPSRSLHPTRDRTRPDLRRPGGDRDRERAPVRRGAGEDARPHRGAATADRDRRRAEGDQPLGVRSPGGAARRW